MEKQKVGAWGEDMAAAFLVRQGFTIIERNWRTRWGEIDIIASRGQHLHFVEVKTRLGLGHGQPEEAVHYYKISRLLQAAKLFLAWRQPPFDDFQFDSVGVVVNKQRQTVRLKYCANIAEI